jgi:hypothetical protein
MLSSPFFDHFRCVLLIVEKQIIFHIQFVPISLSELPCLLLFSDEGMLQFIWIYAFISTV